MSAISLKEGAGSGKSVRGLLDDARTCRGRRPDPVAIAWCNKRGCLARSNGDQPGEAEALYRLASVTYQLGQLDEAFGLALEARDLARRCAAPVVEVWALNLVGIVHHQAGNYSQALESLLQALEIYRSTDRSRRPRQPAQHDRRRAPQPARHRPGDRHLRGGTGGQPQEPAARLRRHHAGQHGQGPRRASGEPARAISLGEAALEIAREHLPEHVAEILANLAEAYADLHLLPQATACLDEADESLARIAAQLTRTPPMAQRRGADRPRPRVHRQRRRR